MEEMTVKTMATTLINEFRSAHVGLHYMWRLKFWLPEQCDSEKIAEYIRSNFSNYEAHQKSDVAIHGRIFPSLSMGTSHGLFFKGNQKELPKMLGFLCYELMTEYDFAVSLPHFYSIQLRVPEWADVSDVADFITTYYDKTAYVKRQNTIVISIE